MQPSEMDQQTKDIVERWKSHKYRPHHVPLTDAVNSLLTDHPLIELRPSPVRGSDWIVCHVGTASPAVFTFAGVFAEADPYETGNLVWGDAPIPAGLDESRVTRFAGFKAAYSYSLETYHDKEIWALQRTLDEYVTTVPGFNPEDLPRLPWQNGDTQHGRFYIRVPMFIPSAGKGPRPKVAGWLHPWVKAAHARSRLYRANPNRPRVRAIVGDTVQDIGSCVPPTLEYGDVVGLVFTIAYVTTPSSWGPVFMVTDVIRVRHADRVAYPLTAEEVDDHISDGGELVVTHNLPPPADEAPVGSAGGSTSRLLKVPSDSTSSGPFVAGTANSELVESLPAQALGAPVGEGVTTTVGHGAVDPPFSPVPVDSQEPVDEDGDSSVTEGSLLSVGTSAGDASDADGDGPLGPIRSMRTRVDAGSGMRGGGPGMGMMAGVGRGRKTNASRARR